MSRRTGRPNIGHATGRGALPDERTGRPNIGHATGRGALPDERTLFYVILVEEYTSALALFIEGNGVIISHNINRITTCSKLPTDINLEKLSK
ncbi:hypothetical protein [Evansella tamaricis]|uniref:Uncharacterized protein n=1 Tax=Evansella tamaricis TaxID=2069301 RepID=A0ABS6JIZ8_9BACI|nr:hypothetical protein [Evansella tamaricis]MBU9712430.1 hypothetical protein [Evansella tamaricis]